MCIAVITTTHPDYPFILISNRDVSASLVVSLLNSTFKEKGRANKHIQEYLSRPTDPANYWPPPHDYILSGRDLERAAKGTWLGITRGGRIACLTNYHEEDAKVVKGAQSRGIIIKNWLQAEGGLDEKPEEWAHRVVESGELNGVGGFTLIYGKLPELGVFDDRNKGKENGHVNGEGKGTKGLAILTNRTTAGSALPYVASEEGQTIAVSNAPFGSRSWPKVTDGEALLADAVERSVNAHEDKDVFTDRLLGVLSVDNMPKWDGKEEWKAYTRKMRQSIFIRSLPLQGPSTSQLSPGQPPAPSGVATPFRTDSPSHTDEQDKMNALGTSAKAGGAGLYGTQKQTIILVDRKGEVTYFERTLFDQDTRPVPAGEGDRKYEFRIEEW